jgi:hypothetical protein
MGFRDELVYGRIIVSAERKPLHFVIADNIYKLLEAAGRCGDFGRRSSLAERPEEAYRFKSGAVH